MQACISANCSFQPRFLRLMTNKFKQLDKQEFAEVNNYRADLPSTIVHGTYTHTSIQHK